MLSIKLVTASWPYRCDTNHFFGAETPVGHVHIIARAATGLVFDVPDFPVVRKLCATMLGEQLAGIINAKNGQVES